LFINHCYFLCFIFVIRFAQILLLKHFTPPLQAVVNFH